MLEQMLAAMEKRISKLEDSLDEYVEISRANAQWIMTHTERENEQKEMYRALRTAVMQWTVTGVLTAVATYFGISFGQGNK